MKKIISIVISCLLIVALAACRGTSDDAESGAVVYSMTGNNDLFEISDGVIVLGEEEEVFDGIQFIKRNLDPFPKQNMLLNRIYDSPTVVAFILPDST